MCVCICVCMCVICVRCTVCVFGCTLVYECIVCVCVCVCVCIVCVHCVCRSALTTLRHSFACRVISLAATETQLYSKVTIPIF